MSRDGSERPAAPASANRANQRSQLPKSNTTLSGSEGVSSQPDGPASAKGGCRHIDFVEINRAALSVLPAIVARVLPGGKRVRHEFVALNPRRPDRHLGSFKININNGRWADFATGDKGGDPVSLVAYLADVSQGEAARLLAQMLNVDSGGRRRG
jgi:hypothetical protein